MDVSRPTVPVLGFVKNKVVNTGPVEIPSVMMTALHPGIIGFVHRTLIRHMHYRRHYRLLTHRKVGKKLLATVSKYKRFAVASAIAASSTAGVVQKMGYSTGRVSDLLIVVSDSVQYWKATKAAVNALKKINAFQNVQRLGPTLMVCGDDSSQLKIQFRDYCRDIHFIHVKNLRLHHLAAANGARPGD